MAIQPYVKTVYVNDNPPAINSSNLNKMEQGIYDATNNNIELNDSINDVDRRTNQILSYVNYGYDEPINYPLGDGSVWNKSIGIFRNGTTIEVNKSVTTAVDIRAKLTGEFELAGNNSGVDAWTTGISFKTGHKYKLVARLISGTANYSSNIVSVYRTGEHASVGIATIKDGVFERLFTAEANINYNVAFFATAEATFSNAKFLLTIEDLTESQLVNLQEQIDEVKLVSESANYSLKSGNITPSGSAGSNNKYIRTYKNNMPKIEKGDILIAKGGFAISNIHIFSANTVASIVHITGLTFTDENRFEVPEEYVGKYLGYTVYEPAKSGQDISADVEDAIKNVSVLHTTPISEVIADLKSQVDAIETDSVSLPDYYFVDWYIDEKCNDINEIGVNIGRKSLRTVFFTDYHLEDNAKQTPNLINYLVEKTGIKNVVFGGDGFNHDYSSKVGGYDMLCEFLNEFKKVNEIANMYLITGNHEMNNADLEHDSVELSKAVPYNLYNNPIFYKIKTLWETGKDTNTFYVDDDVNKMRIYGIDCTSGASIQKSYLDVILPSFLTVPEGYAVIVFSHTGVKNYTKDETVDPPVYTVTELNPAFDAIMQTGKAMNDGANATITATIGGNTYTWNLDFTGNRRIFVGAVVGHVHFDSFYIYDDRFPVVVEICDTGAYRNTHPHRVAGTITEQAFDVIQVNIAEKKIYCTRIGYGSDRTFDFEYFLPVNNKEPYVYRQIPVANAEYERLKKLIGGTVAFNQLVKPKSGSHTSNYVTITHDGNGKISVSGTASANVTFDISNDYPTYIEGHIYYIKGCPSGGSNQTYSLRYNANGFCDIGNGVLVTAVSGNAGNKQIKVGVSYYPKGFVASGQTVDMDFYPQTIDLTAMFGSTIADYIYSLEQATAGSGVAYFRSLFPKDYYAYNAGQLMSVKALSHKMVGFNQWDEEWEVGAYSQANGTKVTSDAQIRSKNKTLVVPSTTYYNKSPQNIRVFFYTENEEFISSASVTANSTFTTLSKCHYITFHVSSYYGTTYNNDICINLHWDGERDGEYEAYSEHIYPLDSDLELRGIPKLDANNKLYYNGDTYESDGTVTRKYKLVDMGELTWAKRTYASTTIFVASLSDGVVTGEATGMGNAITTKYPIVQNQAVTGNDKTFAYGAYWTQGANIYIHDSAYDNNTATEFKTAMSGIYLEYEVETPTTETAEPFTNPQIVVSGGTEEFVDYGVSQGTRDVAIPVGNDTDFYIP